MSYTNSARYRTVREATASLERAGYAVKRQHRATGDVLACYQCDTCIPLLLDIRGELVSNDDVVDLIAAARKPIPFDARYEQERNAAIVMQAMHEKLLAEGYEWDGQDGYSKAT